MGIRRITIKWKLRNASYLSINLVLTHFFHGATMMNLDGKKMCWCMEWGNIKFNLSFNRTWQSWAPSKCKFFMWTVAHKNCWTADRLARKGLHHPAACALCDKTDETNDHLLVSCVFSWQVWFAVLHDLGLQVLAPQAGGKFFEDWWSSAKRGELHHHSWLLVLMESS